MENLKLTENQGVLTVSLNRPEKRNAFFPEMISEITQVFTNYAKDQSLRAILLTGEGASFCAGGDLAWMKSMAGYSLKQNIADANQLFEMYWQIRNCPVPVVGRVFGHCYGGGAGLVAACDVVVAEAQTQFCFSEVKWGLVPAVISPFVVDRAHSGKTSEWFMTGKIFLAPEALLGGLIHYSGSNIEIDFYLEELFKMILNSAPEAVRATKKLLLSYSTVGWKKVRPQVCKLIAERRVSREGQLGLQAFLDKRNPQWSEPPYGAPAKI